MQIMPYGEAKTYRFNPFDLARPGREGLPRIKVGTMELNRNPGPLAQIEQAAFSPANMDRCQRVSRQDVAGS